MKEQQVYLSEGLLNEEVAVPQEGYGATWLAEITETGWCPGSLEFIRPDHLSDPFCMRVQYVVE